jgi:hypothetical protein
MITEIPTPADFHTAGLNQLYLAWEITIQAVGGLEDLKAYNVEGGFEEEEADESTALFWTKSQPALANAYALVQQAMEMALKGRIAETSPYLLIARDPKDWPRGVDKNDVPFSEFRTVDSADLIRLHNTFFSPPLDEQFQSFWSEVRKRRNKLMHSIPSMTFEPTTLVQIILEVAGTLFGEVRWTQRLLDMEASGKRSAYWFYDDASQGIVMQQIDLAIRHLSPAERKAFFGFDSSKRAYRCPFCMSCVDRDFRSGLAALAQLRTKRPGENAIKCIVCETESDVERQNCNNSSCEANVICDNICLTCLWEQDCPARFPSGLVLDDARAVRRYSLDFRNDERRNDQDYASFLDDDMAIEHARRAMSAPYLRDWSSVVVKYDASGPMLSLTSNNDVIIGTWQRNEEGLVWHAGADLGRVDVSGA